MLSFDPKVSVSMIGREAFANDAITAEVARRAAADVIGLNQDACSASRFHYVEVRSSRSMLTANSSSQPWARTPVTGPAPASCCRRAMCANSST